MCRVRKRIHTYIYIYSETRDYIWHCTSESRTARGIDTSKIIQRTVTRVENSRNTYIIKALCFANPISLLLGCAQEAGRVNIYIYTRTSDRILKDFCIYQRFIHSKHMLTNRIKSRRIEKTIEWFRERNERCLTTDAVSCLLIHAESLLKKLSYCYAPILRRS